MLPVVSATCDYELAEVYLPLGLQQVGYPRQHKDVATSDERERRLGAIIPQVINDAACSCDQTQFTSAPPFLSV